MSEEWLSQIKRGTLEYVIMSLIQRKDMYGYEIIQKLDDYPMLKTKENTIYPLLRRLSKNGYLDSYWENIGDGIPSRKYYRITELGISYLTQLDEDWKTLVENIEELKRG